MKGLFFGRGTKAFLIYSRFPVIGVILCHHMLSFCPTKLFPCSRGYSLWKIKSQKNISHSCFPVMGVILDHSHNHLVLNQSFPRYGGYSGVMNAFSTVKKSFPHYGGYSRNHFILQGVINYVNRNL